MATIPQWRSHKVVTADKVIGVSAVLGTSDGANRREDWELECGEVIHALGSLRSRVPDHVSPLGGYYVRYEDGFESWSPAKAFEEGYTKVEG